MSRRKAKKARKIKKYLFLVFWAVLAIAIFALLLFITWKASIVMVAQREIYAFPENAKPGDTLLIKASGEYPLVDASFNNQSINFYRNGQNEDWTAFLGVDAGLVPGKYKITAKAGSDKMEREINVESKEFPSSNIPVTKELQSKGFTAQKAVENIVKNDNPALVEVLEKITPAPYFSGPFSFPLKKMQIGGLDFGKFVKVKSGQLQHLGVDLKASVGTKVYAVNDGKVVFAKELKNYGKTVVIDHGLGIFSLYLHLDQFLVAQDQHVQKDYVIGLSGDTGYSTAPHLHFSIKNNNTRVDPVAFIKTTQMADESLNLANIQRAFLKLLNINN